jgi:hypothetical protein
MYNKLTKKKNSLPRGKKGRTNRSTGKTTGEPIFGNSVNSQISEFKYTKIAVHFHQSRYFFNLKKFI